MSEPRASIAVSPSGREGPDHGPTVDKVTREVRRTSVSALQMADESTNEGCLRKWWYDKVAGVEEESTEAQDTGREHHAYMDTYLRTGSMRMPDRIIRNLHWVPKPGPDLLVEHPTIPELPDNASGLHLAPVRAAGLPLVGFIDLINPRLENVGTGDIENTHDPVGTVKVTDWKFTGSMGYAKTGPELIKTIQMSGYGMYRFATMPGELVRLEHGYFPAKGRGELRSARFDRTAVEKSWEHAESVARSIIDVAKENDPDKVTANRKACRAYNKLCVHAANGSCKAGTHNSLSSISKAKVSPMAVNLIDMLRNKAGVQSAPKPVNVTAELSGKVTAPVAPGPTPEQIAAAKAAEIAKLQAEEVELRAVRAFEVALDSVQAHNRGMPKLIPGSEAAIRYQKARPTAPDEMLDGSGELAGLEISATADVFELLAELDKVAAEALAAAAKAPPPVISNAILSPETPAPVDVPIAATVPQTPASSTIVVEPKKRASRKASGNEVIVVDTATIEAAAKVVNAMDAAGIAVDVKTTCGEFGSRFKDAPMFVESTAINLYVDVTIEGKHPTSLHEVVDAWCAKVADDNDAADIRCAPDKSALSFGKWTGALACYVREQSPQLPPGDYSLDSRGGQVIEVVIEALRSTIRSSGGALIRGHR